jgi:hypothetical protein
MFINIYSLAKRVYMMNIHIYERERTFIILYSSMNIHHIFSHHTVLSTISVACGQRM